MKNSKKHSKLKRVLSERGLHLPEGQMGKLLKILVENKSIISLGPGEPDFEPAQHIMSALNTCIDQGCTHYSPPEGRKELRNEIIKKIKRENKIRAGEENVIVTTGSNEAILLALMASTDPGEHILVPDPGFIAYRPMTLALNGNPISVPLRAENHFKFQSEDLKKSIKNPKKTRALIINSPSNPTGAVSTRRELEEIAQVAIEYDFMIISDEAYEKFLYDGKKHISIGSLNGMEDYVLSLFSFSKTYAMAGFRVGYAVGPKKIVDMMKKLHIYTTLCAPTISQMAAIAALRGPQDLIKKKVNQYDQRRKFICKRLGEIEGLECIIPYGAFYHFVKYNFKMSSVKFAEYLLKKGKVAVVPGIDFGKYGEGFIRLSYATDFNLIKEGMDRIEKSVKKIK